MKNDLTIYDTYAEAWWDGSQKFLRLLHNIVPPRMKHFSGVVGSWEGKKVLDIGCGGGFMSEAMAKLGARVTGIDPAADAIAAAKAHSADTGLSIEYYVARGEDLPFSNDTFDYVVCVDVIEHVEDYHCMLDEIARVLRPGGIFFFDTINRTLIAEIIMIALAENLLGLLPRGTHDPKKFIKPAELTSELEARNFKIGKLLGLGPIGINKRLDFTFGILPSLSIMYMGHAAICKG